MSYDLKVIAGDLVLQNGDFRTVVDSEKLIQDILKVCLTTAGANPLQPWYGSFISRSMIGSPLGTNMVIQLAQSQLQNAIENLMTLQKAQIKAFQTVTPDELIANILDIAVIRSNIDPRLFNVTIKVLSKGFKPISTAFTVNTI
jgi:hypothetical protein